MIRSLSNITELSVIDQNADANMTRCSKLQFDDNHIGSGGFGFVYPVIEVDGVQNDDYLVKIMVTIYHFTPINLAIV